MCMYVCVCNVHVCVGVQWCVHLSDGCVHVCMWVCSDMYICGCVSGSCVHVCVGVQSLQWCVYVNLTYSQTVCLGCTSFH